jgi:hypothetical protein
MIPILLIILIIAIYLGRDEKKVKRKYVRKKPYRRMHHNMTYSYSIDPDENGEQFYPRKL